MRILITGASGQLGGYLLKELEGNRNEVVAWSGAYAGELFGHTLHPIDLTNPQAAIKQAFDEARPDVVIHTAAIARVSDCHANPDRTFRVNAEATGILADICAARGVRLVLISTDLVFDGLFGRYTEDDDPSPISIYGLSKRFAEDLALVASSNHVVARVSLLYGPSLIGRPTFFDDQVAALRGGKPVTLFSDEFRTPLDLPSAARASLELARSNYTGIIHIGGPQRMSRLEMGQRLAKHLGVRGDGIIAALREQFPAPEPRPWDVSLDSSRWRQAFPQVSWPTYDQALRSFFPVTS